MFKIERTTVLVCILLVVLILWYPPIYYLQEIEGRVVDTETKDPLSDVVVMSSWARGMWNPIHYQDLSDVGEQEVVTDLNGDFHFDSELVVRFPLVDVDFYPKLMLFGVNYELKTVHQRAETKKYRLVRGVGWHHGVIELERFQGGMKERSERIRNVIIKTRYLYNPNAVICRKILEEAALYDNWSDYARLRFRTLRKKPCGDTE